MEPRPDTEGIRFSIPGDARYLSLVRAVVTALARDAGLAEGEVDKVEIAVDEACTNVLDHAYRDTSPKPSIDIEVLAEAGRFIVDVIDRGRPFNFGAYVPPKFPDHWMEGQTRGVGLYLIQQCMDSAQYERLPESLNRFRLIKNIKPRILSEKER